MNEEQELPQGWVWTTVEELCEICSGQTPNGITDVLGEGEFPWFRVGDMNTLGNEKHLINASVKLTQSEVERFSIKLRPTGTIVFPKRGGAIATNKKRILSTPSAFDLNTMGLKARVGEDYFWYWFSALDLGTISDGSNVPQINNGDILPLRVPLPPLSEQRRIVAKLEELFSRLDAGVAAVRRTQALLKRYRQSVLHAAVTGELTRAWREAHPAPTETGAALLTRIRAERRAQWEAAQSAKRGGQLPLNDAWKKKYEEPAAPDTSELPELPAGWVWATSAQLCSSVASGSTPKPEELFSDKGEIPFLKVYNLTKTGHLDFTNKPTFIREQIHFGQMNRSRAHPGDVLINIVGPPLGKVSMVTDEYSEWNINQAIVAFKPVPGYSNKFLLTSLLTETVMNWLIRTAKTTTSQVNLSVSVCRLLPLPLPPEAEQAEIVAEVERRLTVLDVLSQTLTAELKRAERLRQSLLHRAFTGRLVPQDATDEPAAALLARLQAETAAAPAKGKGKGKAGRKSKGAEEQLSIEL